ncbi:TPA: small membrane protein, partial [Klebsiella pneumoniae]|nr:small membrane protein [Klebsiella pneumoniae]
LSIYNFYSYIAQRRRLRNIFLSRRRRRKKKIITIKRLTLNK